MSDIPPRRQHSGPPRSSPACSVSLRARGRAAAAAPPRRRAGLRAFGACGWVERTNATARSNWRGSMCQRNQPQTAPIRRQIAAICTQYPGNAFPRCLPQPVAHVDITERFICLEVVEAHLGHARPRVEGSMKTGALPATSKILSGWRACRLDVSILFGNLRARARPAVSCPGSRTTPEATPQRARSPRRARSTRKPWAR